MKCPRRAHPSRRAGIVLVTVSGLLAVLTLLGVAFVASSQAGRGGARGGIDLARARLLARSGAECASARLRGGEDPSYGGEDYDGNGAWEADPAHPERRGQAYRPGSLEIDDCPAEHALRPTFFSGRDGNRDAGGAAAPDVVWVDGKPRGYSGRLRGTYAEGAGRRGDIYSLRIAVAGGIHVNGGDPAAAATEGYNAVLRRILGTLAEAVDREDGANDGAPVDEGDGHALVSSRPAGGWSDEGEIRAALGPTKAQALLPYLALDAWVDRKVIAPNAASVGCPGWYSNWTDLKVRREGARVAGPPSFERIPAAPGGRVVGRAPVPLAWAVRHRPALLALMGDLSGRYLDEAESYSECIWSPWGWSQRDLIGITKEVVLRLDRSAPDWRPGAPSPDECRAVADRLRAWDGGSDLDGDGLADGDLDTWEEWNAFCDDLVDEDMIVNGLLDVLEDGNASGALDAGEDRNGDGRLSMVEEDIGGDGRLQTDEDVNRNGVLDPGESDSDGNGRADIRPLRGATIEERQAKADILKANSNPNSALNKFNPNRTSWRTVDKSDLVVSSTELCLWPCQGWDVASAGRVADGQGRVLAQAIVDGRLAPPRVAQITTQREFVASDLGDPEVAGDEAGIRQPGRVTYLSQSRGTARTWGHRLSSVGWMDGDSQGTGLQMYPEPYVDAGGGLTMSPADWDGNLQLATVETSADDTYGVAAGPSDMKLLGRYDDGLDLDLADGPAAHQPDVRQAPVTNGLLDPNAPSTLYPDGVYAEWERAPGYLAQGNVPSFHGVMSFWMKPNYQGRYKKTWEYARAHRWIGMSRQALDTSEMQFFGLGHECPPWESAGIYFEVGSDPSDARHEHQFRTPIRPFLPHRWYLITAQWDFLVPDNAHGGSVHDCGEMVVDGGALAGDIGAANGYFGSSPQNDPAAAVDITGDDTFGQTMIYFGKRRILGEPYVFQCAGRGADVSVDEFAVYDFGGAVYAPAGEDGSPSVSAPAPAATLLAPRVLAAERFAEGRYYKGGAYWRADVPAPAEAAGAYVSAPVPLPQGARIREIRWTLLRSRQRDGAGRLSLSADHAAVEILGPAGTGYPGGDDSWRSPRAPALSHWRVDRVAPATPRLRVLLCRDAAVPPDEPILDSPILDDVTILYDAAGGAPWCRWRESP